MSLCDLGRPPRDAAVENLSVNDTLRVNKLLKVTKAEIDRLCAVDDNNTITFTGSFEYFDEQNPQTPISNYSLWTLPTGAKYVNNSSVSTVGDPALNLTLYTDKELVIEYFQVTSSDYTNPSSTQNINVSVSSGATPASVTDILTLNLLNINPNAARATYEGSNVVIPANSFYSIHLRQGAGSVGGVSIIRTSWTLVLGPR